MFKNKSIDMMICMAEKEISEEAQTILTKEEEEETALTTFREAVKAFLDPFLPAVVSDLITEANNPIGNKFLVKADLEPAYMLPLYIEGFLPETGVDTLKCYTQMRFWVNIPIGINNDDEFGYNVRYTRQDYRKLYRALNDCKIGYTYLKQYEETCKHNNENQSEFEKKRLEVVLAYKNRFETWRTALGKFGYCDPESVTAAAIVDVAESLDALKHIFSNREI